MSVKLGFVKTLFVSCAAALLVGCGSAEGRYLAKMKREAHKNDKRNAQHVRCPSRRGLDRGYTL